MEQLIIFLLLAIGSALSGYLQKKRRREAEQAERPTTPPGERPVPSWPATTRDWQEELRRILQGELKPAPPHPVAPPPIPPPVRKTPKSPVPVPERSEGTVQLPSPLTQSASAYSRAAQLATRVEKRLQAIDAQTTSHVRAPGTRPKVSSAAAVVKRWTRDPESVREAFIASLIFGPPVGLRETPETP